MSKENPGLALGENLRPFSIKIKSFMRATSHRVGRRTIHGVDLQQKRKEKKKFSCSKLFLLF